jgi:pimeloyl-ACP methyl ester carboxylesterase
VSVFWRDFWFFFAKIMTKFKRLKTNKTKNYKRMKKTISAEFPFESKFIEIKGSKMHYIDKGKGDPVLFLHGNPKDVHDMIDSYHNLLKETPIPKLCFYAEPGLIIPKSQIPWIEENFPNTEMVNIGKERHFIQEDHPNTIGKELAKWYGNI